jgi:hypothetical protein
VSGQQYNQLHYPLGLNNGFNDFNKIPTTFLWEKSNNLFIPMEKQIKHMLYHTGRELAVGELRCSPWEGPFDLYVDSISISKNVEQHFPLMNDHFEGR